MHVADGRKGDESFNTGWKRDTVAARRDVARSGLVGSYRFGKKTLAVSGASACSARCRDEADRIVPEEKKAALVGETHPVGAALPQVAPK